MSTVIDLAAARYERRPGARRGRHGGPVVILDHPTAAPETLPECAAELEGLEGKGFDPELELVEAYASVSIGPDGYAACGTDFRTPVFQMFCGCVHCRQQRAWWGKRK